MRATQHTDTRKLAAALARLKSLKLSSCFDASNPDSRPTPAQENVLQDIGSVAYRYVTAGNQSGKSQLAAREASWVLTDTHPYWTRPAEWGDEPLLMLAVGRTKAHCEDVLWRKIKSFLDPGDYHETRVGNQLAKITFKPNGNQILFLSHHSEKEAREKLQAFVAHYVWLDEMPQSVRLFEELNRRVQSKKGPFLATFTPKDVNVDIRKWVDALTAPFGKKYAFSALDNPIYTEREKEQIFESIKTLPKQQQNTILYGDWSSGDNAVYYFDYDRYVEDPNPLGYSSSWRHVESSDPASQSKYGLVVAAENPRNGVWYVILSDYLHGIYVPDDIAREVKKRTSPYNIVRRICDPANPWYIHTASKHGMVYMCPNKRDRKTELIKNLQQALGGKVRIAPWCENLLEELTSAQWSETAEGKIANASIFHCSDALQYMVDCLPTSLVPVEQKDWWTELREANAVRKKTEAAPKTLSSRVQVGIKRRSKAWAR